MKLDSSMRTIMSVEKALLNRKTVRAFKPNPVPKALIEELVELANRAPSNGNLQPWRVIALSGESLEVLKTKAVQKLQQDGFEQPEYQVYVSPMPEPYRSYRFAVGEALYKTIGVAREDKAGRQAQFAKNAELFGAPLGLFFYIDRRLGPGQWMDLGMYIQSLMLLLEERGLSSCAQGYWSFLHETVASVTEASAEWMLACGLAVGYKDKEASINSLESSRQPLGDFFHLKE
jgi:nitroreductase